jgi:hypothetical protein
MTGLACWPAALRFIRLAVLAAALVVVSGAARCVGAEGSWEYSPYRVRIWLALEPTPQLPASLVETLNESIVRHSSAVLGAVWQVEAVPPPAALRPLMVQDLEHVGVDAIVAAAERADLEADKLYLTSVRRRDGELVVSVRELDCRSRQPGELIEHACPAPALLAGTLWDALVDSFTPLARIEQVEDKQVVARLRAGGLITNNESPANIEPGAVLRPVVRRNDRTGQPAKGGIQAIPWTMLVVDDRAEAVLDCTLTSGYRAAIPVRGSARIERLALLLRPRYETTRLVLRSRTEPTKPLAGYDIYRRGASPEETELLGTTDRDGAIELTREAGNLETLLVKNGQQLLARLPVVAGQAPELTARIVDDDARLAAEGYIAALSSRALDLVARREILAARIRGRLKDGQHDEAQKLLDDFRRLETRTDLSRDFDAYRQQLPAGDKLTQERINRLFTEAQKFLLSRPLSDELLSQLTREVEQSKARS